MSQPFGDEGPPEFDEARSDRGQESGLPGHSGRIGRAQAARNDPEALRGAVGPPKPKCVISMDECIT